MSSISQQRSPSPMPPSSSQHLNPHHPHAHSHSHPVSTSSYASSISSLPISRPSSPASMLATGSSVPTPPPSPTPYHLTSFGSTPGSPTFHNNSTDAVIALGQQSGISVALPEHSNNTSSSSLSLGSLLYQPITRTVIVLTLVFSCIALGGKFPDHCTAPTYVLYEQQYPAMLASPFVVPLTPALLESAHQTVGTSLFLAVSNLISLALFEERLTAVFSGNGSKIFRNLCMTIVVLVLALRQLLGFIFSRALGWHFPQLFFSDSMYECNLGLAPFLFALLVVQALFQESTSSWSGLQSGYKSTTSFLTTIPRIYLQIILCLFNVIPKTIVWWAGSGLVVGLVVALTISFQRTMGHWGGKVKTSAFKLQQWEETDPVIFINEEEQSSLLTQEVDEELQDSFVRPASIQKRLLNTLCKVILYILPLTAVLLMILVGINQLHTFKPDVSSDLLNETIEPQTPYLLTLVLMTAPRRGGASFIRETLSSYLDNFPEETSHPLYSRIQVVVYTHLSDFAAYDEAKVYFDTIPKARKHVKWVKEEGTEMNQRKHLISAIRKVGVEEDTVYLGIMEDDFPFCQGGWQRMLNTIYEANQQVPEHCGVFITTGGSGLIFKRSVAVTATFVLENDLQIHERGGLASPPDVTLQDCMLGKREYCSSCAGNLVISKTLLQGHLGYNTSTSGGSYKHDEFQCGWKHPFNGPPDIHVV